MVLPAESIPLLAISAPACHQHRIVKQVIGGAVLLENDHDVLKFSRQDVIPCGWCPTAVQAEQNALQSATNNDSNNKATRPIDRPPSPLDTT